MSIFRVLIIAIAALALPAVAAAQTSTANLVATVDRLLELERARQAPGATVADIDKLLALMADSVVYEHPRARARIQGKALMRQGMRNFLGTVRNARDSVVQRTVAPGVLVLVTQSSAEISNNGKWEPMNRRAIRVFEFDGDLIRRIIEYGW
jgi:hypothetical protein